jgi:RNA polymerase sigma factor (sigma-70 family)
MIAHRCSTSAQEDPVHASGDDDGALLRQRSRSVTAAEFARWRSGDDTGLECLVRRFSGTMWHIARAYGLEAAGAEDAVQSAWEAFVKHADTIREPAAIPGWLARTTQREALHLARSRARRRESPPLDEVGVPEKPQPGSPTAEDHAIASIEAHALWGLVSRLSERCRHLIRVTAFSRDPAFATLSEELGMPAGSVGPSRARCLAKLRALIAADPAWSHR